MPTMGAGECNFMGVQNIFCPNFPQICPKKFMRRAFLYKFSVAVGYSSALTN